MRKLIVIGTLHAGLTPEEELIEAIKKCSPNQLLIEIAEKDIKKNKIEAYPSEMIAAYKWAIKNKIRVDGFDSKINTLKEGMTEKDNQAAIKEQKKIMKEFTWKDMNKPENNKKLKIDAAKRLIDYKKEEKRDIEMLQNINNQMITDGVIVIVTGCRHLDFFEKNLKAFFPYR